MVVKGRLCSGASFYPGMEMVACQSCEGSGEGEMWLEEIMRTSCGLASRALNRIYVENIAGAVERFPEIGVDHAKRTDPKVACFAERMRPTYAWGDWDAIRARARARLEAAGVAILERVRLLTILKSNGRVCGCTCADGEEIFSLAAPAVILCTGGFGDLYLHNLNTGDVSGDGQALALAAGASLINVEFLQFIPGFLSPAYKTVFREMSMPYIVSYRQADGRDLFDGYPIGKAERAECLRLRATHGPFSFESPARHFDIAMMRAIARCGGAGVAVRYDPRICEDDFTFIGPYVKWLRETRGIEIGRDEIHIAPFYHAANGGVRIDARAMTRVPGLFACGEVSGGIHGANRQGGMSTGSCLVFGELAGKSAAEYAAGAHCEGFAPEDAQAELERVYGSGEGRGDPEAVISEIRTMMWEKASIVRSEETLSEALATLDRLDDQFCAGRRVLEGKARNACVRAAHHLTNARALLTAMRNRRESRGAHYREDYPQRDEAQFLRRFEVTLGENGMEIHPERED